MGSVDGRVEPPRWPAVPYPVTVEFEPLEIPARDAAANPIHGAELFLKTIADRKVFEQFARRGAIEGGPNLRLEGSVSSRWNPHSTANFFTWFPGGLIGAPNWRGTRMEFLAEAHLTLVDARTGALVSRYDAEVEYELVHKSNNPVPFFSAIAVVPGIFNGSIRTFPRKRYRRQIEPLAFEELWSRLEGQLLADTERRFIASGE